MRVLALDPGLAACGFAMLDVGEHVEMLLARPIRVVDLGAFVTSKATGTMVARLDELACDLLHLMTSAPPAVVVAEAPAWPRSARGAAMLALAYGVIRGLCSGQGAPPLVTLSAQRWRKALGLPGRSTADEGGDRRARKADVAAKCTAAFPEARAILRKMKRKHHEHALDALAIGWAWSRERRPGA